MCKRIFKYQTNDKIGIPFYKIGTFGYVADAYISYSLYNEYKTKYPYPKKGDILISAAGTIGRTVVYNGEKAYYQDSNIVWLNINENKISNTFLKYFYKIAKWNGIEGSTIQRLYNFNILSTKIKLPSLEEQIQIGNFFKQLDETIALHKRKLKKQQNSKKFYLEKMFPKENSLFPEIRFPNFTDAWEQRELGEISENFDNFRVPVAENLRKEGKTAYFGANGIQGFIDGFTHDGEFVLIAEDGANDLKNYPVQYVTGKIWVNNHAHVLQGIPLVLNNLFLTYRIKSMDISKYLVGGGRAKLNASTMKEINICFPNVSEQTQIGNFFKQLDETIALHKRMIEKLEKIKQAYLKRMFI